MNTLEDRVEEALYDPNPRESEHRVKAAVANALEAFDPSATLKITNYFNHTFAPDMVLSWGKVERPVFLRFTDNLPELGHDIALLDNLDPFVFGLSTPPRDEAAESRLDERSRVADVFLTTPSAVEELTSRNEPAATDRMLRNSLAHAGRGAILSADEADQVADTLQAGVGAAEAGQVEGTRNALAMIDRYFGPGQAQRLGRVVQAVWEGSGSRLDQYPGDAELSTDVGALSLVYLLQFMDTAESAFWRGVGRGISVEQLVELARAGVAEHENFQHLVNANLDVLRARACLVQDTGALDDPDQLRWHVELPVSDKAPALALRGPAFHAFITTGKEQLGGWMQPPGPGLPVETYVERADKAHIASVEVTGGGKHISVSDESGNTDSAFLQTTTQAIPAARVDKATVITLSGRVNVDFPRRTGTGVTRSDTLAADLVHATASLLVPLSPDELTDLSEFLKIGTRQSEPDSPDSASTLFDENEEDDEPQP